VRAASVEGLDSLAPECRRFAQLIIATSYGQPSLPDTPPTRTVLRMSKDWIECGDDNEAFNRHVMARGYPPMPATAPRQPRKIKHQDPVYPAQAVAARVSGNVSVRAVVAPSGCVAVAWVTESVPLLDLAALQVVTYWRFTPLEIGGQRMQYPMTATVTFELPK